MTPRKFPDPTEVVKFLRESGLRWAEIADLTGANRSTILRIAHGASPRIGLRRQLLELYAEQKRANARLAARLRKTDAIDKEINNA